jgi:hypothetical protein
LTLRSRPALEGVAREVGQQLVAVDAEHLLHEPPVQPTRFIALAAPRLARASPAGQVRVAQQPLAEARPLLARPHGLEAVHQLREVELELVPVARRVRALDLAQLALEARVHDLALVALPELA